VLLVLLPLAALAQPNVGPVPQSAVGAVNGVAPLDGTSHVPIANIPIGSTATTVPTGLMLANGLGAASVTATGTTQGTAAPMTRPTMIITGGAANAGIIVVASIPAGRVVNLTSFTILLYPPVGGTMNGLGTNLPVSILSNGSATVGSPDLVTWSAG
jgi:hypothetical protein